MDWSGAIQQRRIKPTTLQYAPICIHQSMGGVDRSFHEEIRVLLGEEQGRFAFFVSGRTVVDPTCRVAFVSLSYVPCDRSNCVRQGLWKAMFRQLGELRGSHLCAIARRHGRQEPQTFEVPTKVGAGDLVGQDGVQRRALGALMAMFERAVRSDDMQFEMTVSGTQKVSVHCKRRLEVEMGVV